MDRDCSGEITLDEAMTTLFERQGADNLAEVTQQFFRAAGVHDGDEPPPGATIQFYQYYRKIGCAKTKVPSPFDLRRTFSTQLRKGSGQGEAPKLRSSMSTGSIPPLPRLIDVTFNAFKHPSTLRKPSPPRVVPAPETRSGSRSPKRAGTAATPYRGSGRGGAAGVLSALKGSGSSSKLGRPDTVSSSGGSSKGGGKFATNRSASGGIVPLKPITQTGDLATSALKASGHHMRKEDITNVKQRASQALKLSSQDFKAGAPALPDTYDDDEKPQARFSPAVVSPAARSPARPPAPTGAAASSSMPDLS